MRHEVTADVRLVVGEGRVLLAAPARQLSDPPLADIFDGQALRHGCWSGLGRGHGLEHPGLGLALGQAIVCAGQPDRAEGTLDALPADVPLIRTSGR